MDQAFGTLLCLSFVSIEPWNAISSIAGGGIDACEQVNRRDRKQILVPPLRSTDSRLDFSDFPQATDG